MSAEKHAHPVVAMMGGIMIGLILGGISVYYWEEMLQLQAQQDAQAQTASKEVAAPAPAQSGVVNPLGDVKINPFE